MLFKDHGWRFFRQGGVFLSSILLLSSSVIAGPLDQCHFTFDEDARFRRMFPTVSKDHFGQIDMTVYQVIDMASRKVNYLEGKHEYQVVFKLPDSYQALDGRLIVPIEKLPPEGRIDVIQAGETLFRVNHMKNNEITLEPIEVVDGEIVSQGITLSNQTSRIYYSERMQISTLPGENGPKKENRPLSAVIELDLATLEVMSGQSWRNFQLESFPDSDLLAKASMIKKQAPLEPISIRYKKEGNGASAVLIETTESEKPRPGSANRWIFKLPEDQAFHSISIKDPTTQNSVKLVRDLGWQLESVGEIKLTIEGEGRLRPHRARTTFNGAIRVVETRAGKYEKFEGRFTYKTEKFLVIEGNISELMQTVMEEMTRMDRLEGGGASRNLPQRPRPGGSGTVDGIVLPDPNRDLGAPFSQRVAFENRSDPKKD